MKPASDESGVVESSIGNQLADPEHTLAGGERASHAVTARHGGALPFLDTIQKSFGRHDVSHVRAHADTQAARALGAEAFTRGSDVTFSQPPSLHTAAHEAAHVIQQRTGVELGGGVGQEGDAYERHADEVANRVASGQSSEELLDAQPGAGGRRLDATQDFGTTQEVADSSPPVVQFRRIPPNVRALLTAVGGSGKGANFDANAEGVLRLIDLAMEELTPAQRTAVHTARLAGMTAAEFNALPRLERRSLYVEAILAQFPSLQLGDPALLEVHPRVGTSDTVNIAKVVGHADTIFNAIATGAHDTWLTQVFGAANLATAKSNYALARTQMNTLHSSNNIVTDRGSGFSDEVQEGGLSGPDQISVTSSTIDLPDDIESRVTLIHESMHAGNSDISDDVYIGATGFETQTDAKKLVNAAHYEVVPWRILAPADSRAYQILPATVPPTFKTFVPAGTTVGGVTAAARTKAEEGAVAAYDLAQGAWALGLNLHRQYVQLLRTPTDWTVPQFGGSVRFDNSLPFWSKVQKLTIHRKTVIAPTSPDPAKHPVSQIDIALSEGMTRRLALTMNVLEPLNTHAAILAFEASNSTVGERAAAFPGGAHNSVSTERNFLLKLAARHPTVGTVTGAAWRDVLVIRKMGDPALSLWSDILRPRNPDTFID